MTDLEQKARDLARDHFCKYCRSELRLIDYSIFGEELSIALICDKCDVKYTYYNHRLAEVFEWGGFYD